MFAYFVNVNLSTADRYKKTEAWNRANSSIMYKGRQ